MSLQRKAIPDLADLTIYSCDHVASSSSILPFSINLKFQSEISQPNLPRSKKIDEEKFKFESFNSKFLNLSCFASERQRSPVNNSSLTSGYFF